MKLGIIGLAVLLVSFSIFGTITISTRSQQERLAELQSAKDRGTISWHAKVANAKGKREVSLAIPPIEYTTAINSVDEALTSFGAIVAEPISKQSIIASTNEIYKDNEIRTWYKVRVLENLSEKPIPQCSSCSSFGDPIPPEMLPTNADEILIETYGGSVEIEGVRVNLFDEQVPNLSTSHKYLLFVTMDSSGRVGLLRMGPVGVYQIRPDGSLDAASKRAHPLKNEIETRFGNSVETIRGHIRKQVLTR